MQTVSNDRRKKTQNRLKKQQRWIEHTLFASIHTNPNMKWLENEIWCAANSQQPSNGVEKYSSRNSKRKWNEENKKKTHRHIGGRHTFEKKIY